MHWARSSSSTQSTAFSSIFPFRTAISRVFRAVLASPLANRAIAASWDSPMEIKRLPNPLGLSRAWCRSFTSSGSSNGFRINTLHRDKRAELISKEGFSVVAPTSTMLPFSTKGRKASCCALLNRWISSVNSKVRIPILRFCSAWFMTSFTSLIPLVTALNSTNSARVFFAMILARVVFPTPGGPQKIMEDT